jgi:hypothetical protein
MEPLLWMYTELLIGFYWGGQHIITVILDTNLKCFVLLLHSIQSLLVELQMPMIFLGQVKYRF